MILQQKNCLISLTLHPAYSLETGVTQHCKQQATRWSGLDQASQLRELKIKILVEYIILTLASLPSPCLEVDVKHL